MKTIFSRFVGTCQLVLAFSLIPVGLFAQGSLAPSGPPAPTMKTLDQIEPRTPVDATHTPGDSNDMFILNKPGSYYLTTNIISTNINMTGILITTNNVTLDLRGFSLIGTGAPGQAITVNSPHTNIVIRNGTISGWSWGVSGAYAVNSQMERLALSANSQYGIITGTGCRISECTVSGSFYGGISAGNGSSISACVAWNDTDGGIFAGDGSIISGCTAWNNPIYGIQAGNDCTILDCNASTNATYIGGSGSFGGISVLDRCTIRGCVADANGFGTNGFGIMTGIRATVVNCSVNNNHSVGIYVGGDSTVLNNHASQNGQGGTAAGIQTPGTGSRIEGNQVRDNVGTGILATGNDIIVRNSAGGNTLNYSPSTGANFGPIQSPSTATSPWANFAF